MSEYKRRRAYMNEYNIKRSGSGLRPSIAIFVEHDSITIISAGRNNLIEVFLVWLEWLGWWQPKQPKNFITFVSADLNNMSKQVDYI